MHFHPLQHAGLSREGVPVAVSGEMLPISLCFSASSLPAQRGVFQSMQRVVDGKLPIAAQGSRFS
jgi:hypothetical protein